jgi:transposase
LPPEIISASQDLVVAGKYVVQAVKRLGIGRSTAYKVIRNTTQ